MSFHTGYQDSSQLTQDDQIWRSQWGMLPDCQILPYVFWSQGSFPPPPFCIFSVGDSSGVRGHCGTLAWTDGILFWEVGQINSPESGNQGCQAASQSKWVQFAHRGSLYCYSFVNSVSNSAEGCASQAACSPLNKAQQWCLYSESHRCGSTVYLP